MYKLKLAIGYGLLLFSQLAMSQLTNYGYSQTSLFPYANSIAVELYKGSTTSLLFFNEGSVLHVADVSMPGSLSIMSSTRLNFPIKYIAISSDGTRIAASGDEKIVVLNSSNPLSLQILGELDFTDDASLEPQQQGGMPKGMAFRDNNTLITTVTPKGIWALDLAALPTVSIVGEFLDTGTNVVWDVEIIDNYAFVADGLDGLNVFDISDSSNLTLVYTDSSLTDARDIQISNNIAYISRGSVGISVATLTTQPILGVSVQGALTGNETGAEWSGYVYRSNPLPNNHISLATNSRFDGLVTLDISDINNPLLIDKSDVTTGQFAVDGYYIYAAIGDPEYGETHGIGIYDSKDNTSNNIVPPVELFFRQSVGLNNKVSVNGNSTLIVPDNGGAVVVDNSLISQPGIGAWLLADKEVSAAVKFNQFVVSAANNDKKLYVHDISNMNSPVLLPTYDFGLYRPLDIIVTGTNAMLVITTRNYQEYFYNWMEIDGSGNLNLISQQSIQGRLSYNDMSGDTVVGGGVDKFFVVDYSDNTTPVITKEYDTPFIISDIEIDGDYVYVSTNNNTSGDFGVYIYDISNPTLTNVSLISTEPVPVNGVNVRNNIAFLAADQLLGLMIYDVTNPIMPQQLDVYNTPGRAVSVDAGESLLGLADEGTGTYIFSQVRIIFTSGFE